MGLWRFVSRRGFLELTIVLIHVIVTLWLSRNAITFIQAGIKPLGTMGNTCLVQFVINQFLVKYSRIFCSGEVAIFYAPCFPAICHSMRPLFYRCFAPQRSVGQR